MHTRAPGSRIKKWDFMQLLIQENGPLMDNMTDVFKHLYYVLNLMSLNSIPYGTILPL